MTYIKKNALAQKYFRSSLQNSKEILKPIALAGFIAMAIPSTGTAVTDPLSTTVATSVVIDQVEGVISDQMQNAKVHADFAIWRAGQEALKALEQWKSVNSDLLDKTFDEIKTERKAFLAEINAIWSDAKIDRSILVKAAEDFNIQWASTLKNTIFADSRTELFSYYPKAVIANDRKILVTLAGPNIGLSNAEIRWSDGSKYKFSQTTDFKAVAEVSIPEEVFSADEKIVKLKVIYQRDPDAWFFKEETEKELVFLKLPEKVGSYTLQPKIKVSDVERSTFDTRAEAAGKNIHASVPIQVPPNLIKDGWRIDSEAIFADFNAKGQGVYKFDEAGEKGSCNGVNPNTLADNGFEYKIHIGKTRSISGSKGGWQRCDIRVPIIRDIETIVQADKTNGKLSWSSDSKIELPENFDSFELVIDQFDGKRIVLAQADKTEFFDLQPHDQSVLLKPKKPQNIPF